MDSKVLKQIGKAVVIKNSSLQILENMKIAKGEVVVTSLDTYFKSNIDIKGDCLVRFADFYKSGSIEDSIVAGANVDGFPEWPELKDKRHIPADIFNRSYKSFLAYSSRDVNRPILKNVNIQRNYAGWATDGHRAIVDESVKSPVTLSLSEEFVTVLDILLSAGEHVKSACVSNAYSEEKKYSKAQIKAIEKKRNRISAKITEIQGAIDKEIAKPYDDIQAKLIGKYRNEIAKLREQQPKLPNPDISEYACRHKYIQIETENCTVISKMADEIISAIGKVLPDTKKSLPVRVSAEEVKVLAESLRVLFPWANIKTHMVVFKGDTVYCINRDKGKEFKINLPFAIAPESRLIKDAEGKETQEPYPLIGFNAEYLLQILGDIEEDSVLYYGQSQVSALWIKGKGQQGRLLMPLRVIEECLQQEDLNRAKLLPVPSINKKKALVKGVDSGYCLYLLEGGYKILKAKAKNPGCLIKNLSDREYRALVKIGMIA